MNNYLQLTTFFRLLLVTTSFFVITYSSFSQRNEKKLIGFSCGYIGKSSKIVYKIDSDIKKHSYSSIKRNLHKRNPAKSFLAAVTLTTLESLNEFKLSPRSIKRISKIKLSNKQFSYCSGCTIHNTISLKDALSDENNQTYQAAVSFAKRSFYYHKFSQK